MAAAWAAATGAACAGAATGRATGAASLVSSVEVVGTSVAGVVASGAGVVSAAVGRVRGGRQDQDERFWVKGRGEGGHTGRHDYEEFLFFGGRGGVTEM